MQADHARDLRKAEDELAQAAQVSCLALPAEVSFNVAWLLVSMVCRRLARCLLVDCGFLHPGADRASAGEGSTVFVVPR